MLEILRGIRSEQAEIKGAAVKHQADDQTAFGILGGALTEIKDGQEALKSQFTTLAESVAKITPIVDELKADKIRALERAAVIRELAVEKSRADEKVAVTKDRNDEKLSRWLTPLLAAAVTAILALAGGWANDHFHRAPEVKSSTTITSTIDKPR